MWPCLGNGKTRPRREALCADGALRSGARDAAGRTGGTPVCWIKIIEGLQAAIKRG